MSTTFGKFEFNILFTQSCSVGYIVVHTFCLRLEEQTNQKPKGCLLGGVKTGQPIPGEEPHSWATK